MDTTFIWLSKQALRRIREAASFRLEAALFGTGTPDGFARRVNPITGRVFWVNADGRSRSTEMPRV